MLTRLVGLLPLSLFTPFRAGIHRFPRGSLGRNICLVVVQQAVRANRGRLADRVPEIRPLDDPTAVFQSVDSMVMDAVYWTGIQGYEGILSEVWKALCAKSHSVLEIGGNVGLFTVIGARKAKGSYTVLEPLPENAAVLADNLRRNGIGHVELVEAAATPAAVPARIELNVPDEKRGAPVGAHLTSGSEVSGRRSLRVIGVDGQPFRALVAGRDLIKIDAEGIESDLLLSAADIITETRPTLVVEVLPEAKKLARTLVELAASAAYTISIVPAYGSEVIVEVPADEFTADLPGRFHSKDIVLSSERLNVPFRIARAAGGPKG